MTELISAVCLGPTVDAGKIIDAGPPAPAGYHLGVDSLNAPNTTDSLRSTVTMDLGLKSYDNKNNRKKGTRSVEWSANLSNPHSQNEKTKRAKKQTADPCRSCSATCEADSCIACTNCKTVVHLKRMGFRRATLPNINDIALLLKYTCVSCRDSANDALRAEIKVLRDMLQVIANGDGNRSINH